VEEFFACLICGVSVRMAKSKYCQEDAKRYGIELAIKEEYEHHWTVAKKVPWNGGEIFRGLS